MMQLDKAQQEKILTPPVRLLMEILRPEGEVRVVGGAVRDLILKRDIGDIDLATNLLPERVMDLLAWRNIKTVPTGLTHGTITAVVDHAGYEITTLRHDVATDGRHAEVAFTQDWQADAARRDFTFNALYVDEHGELYDYFNGVTDAQAGHVRFIGDASARIREDVLRILRFFRFYAWFGQGDADAQGLAASRDLAGLMSKLSAERVAREIQKLLAAPDPALAWKLIIDHNIMPYVVAQATDLARLQSLIDAEKQNNELPAPLTRLAALLPQDEETAVAVAGKLKFSNRDAERLRLLAILPAQMAATPLRALLYRYGVDACRAAVFLFGENVAPNLAVIAAWENPVFPIRGEDLVGAGIQAGPRIGDILRATEQWWIDGDFRADRQACLDQAAQYGKNH